MKVKINRKTLRRGKHKIRKFLLFFIPTLVVCLGILIIFIIMLIPALRKPLYISPLSTLGIQAIRSSEDFERQTLEDILHNNKISFKKLSRIPDSSYKILTENDGEIIVTFKKDIHQQISSLQFILSRLTMEGKQFTRLDLRYDKPVINLYKKYEK